MDNFAGSHYYSLNRILISAIGLWPFNRTIYTKLLNVIAVFLLLFTIFGQLVKLITAKLSTALRWKIVSCIAYSCIFVVKYTGYLYYIEDLKWMFQRITYDWNSLKNEAELRIIHEYTKTMKMLSIGFALILCPTILTFILKTFSNDILDFLIPMNYTRPRVLPIMMEYFIDQDKFFYYIVIYINLTIGLGALSVFVTEVNSIAVIYHICGMLKIVCYVDVIQLKVMPLYNLFCIFGLITFILALFQFAKAMTTRDNMEELLASLCTVITSVLYAFAVIHFAQKLTDHSSDIFQHLYNIKWYDLPMVEQKVVLFLMRNSLKDLTFIIGGVIVASHDMFTMNSEISLFETNIRFMGSLLACYALTGDVMFRDKAAQLGERMLPAFQTETGIPHSLINLHTGASKNYGWASSGCSILSEIGTMHLEFTYLSDITGNPVFKSKVENVRKVLKNLEKPKGLYPNYIHPKTGKWGQHHMSLGGLGDSFYEYLLKAWIQSGKEDVEARQMYDEAIAAIDQHMIKTSQGKLLYVSDLKYDRLEHKMGHLACFAGGMFALGAKTQENELSERYMTIAAGLTNTCHESYDRSYTKLGPEAFHFIEGNEAKSLKNGEKYYILRPETFESYFVMWRLTKDPKYREWGWEAVQALEKYCRVPGGFTGLHNVYLVDPPQDDVQQSYFFAETLKYLYLLFSDDDLINLNDWVFNSEAHVLPIRGNPLYRASPSL